MSALEKVIESAKNHGELSESQHEVGDLQEALRLMWKLLSSTQRKVFKDDSKEAGLQDWA